MVRPDTVEYYARKKENKNYKFRTWLKCHADPDDLDKRFKALHEELFTDYDCCKCGNCCRKYRVILEPGEAERIAVYLAMPVEEFKGKYIIDDTRTLDDASAMDDEYAGKDMFPAPCPMLCEDGKCRIQEVKPEECKGFPYTDRPDRMGSLLGVLEFAETCPVVYEIVERLKESYQFR